MTYTPREPVEPQAERPHFPPDYGINTDMEGLLPWSWALERLGSARSYWVSTASPDGRPHAAPVWAVVMNGVLYFSTDTRSVKGRNIAATGRLVVHLESGDEVVILNGTVESFQDPTDVPGLVEHYTKKYGVDVTTLPMADAVWYAVIPETAQGWLEADFPTTATRWVFPEC